MDAQPSVNELAFASHRSVARFGKVGSDTVTVREGGVNDVNTGKLEWSLCRPVGLQL